MDAECVTGGPLEMYGVPTAEEVQSFAARLEVHPDDLKHIIEPMDDVIGINLRQELERWVNDHLEEKERTRGMTLDQLVADVQATLTPSMNAALRRAQDLLLAALNREEEEKAARKNVLKAKAAL